MEQRRAWLMRGIIGASLAALVLSLSAWWVSYGKNLHYIAEVTARGASDLHLTAGSPPAARVRGRLERLGETALTADDLQRLAEGLHVRLFAPGETILRQGDAGESFFVIHRGHVSVHVGTDGAQQEVARLGAGQFFGEMSLMTGDRRSATVRAREPRVVESPLWKERVRERLQRYGVREGPATWRLRENAVTTTAEVLDEA